MSIEEYMDHMELWTYKFEALMTEALPRKGVIDVPNTMHHICDAFRRGMIDVYLREITKND